MTLNVLLFILKMGFLRRNSNGTTGYHIIEKRDYENEDSETDEAEVKDTEVKVDATKVKAEAEIKEEISEPEPKADQETSEQVKNTEKDVTIGNLMMGLQASSYSMANYFEEKKNKTKPSNKLYIIFVSS